MDTYRTGERGRRGAALRTKAAAATNEFNTALGEWIGQGTPAERTRLHTATVALMSVLARVLIQLE